jgi:hypothetical protein
MQHDDSIRGTVIGQHGAYTVILRQEHLEFYQTDKGPWEKRNVPDFLLTPDETDDLFAFHAALQVAPKAESQPSYQQRRNKRFYAATIAVLKDIEDRAMQQPLELRYSAAYGILRGYFEALLTNFAEAFTPEQLGEIRIVLDQLTASTVEDTHLSDETRRHLALLAKTLREAGEEA